MYQKDDDKESAEKLTAANFNYDNGTMTETKLNSKDIFEEKANKNHYAKKFTLPAVKEGSIIEYSYIIKSDFIFNLPEWEFQNAGCPVLGSECNVKIPGILSNMTFFQGYHKYFIDKSIEGFQNYSLLRRVTAEGLTASSGNEHISVSAPTTVRRWVMKDLPAFYAENYVSSPVNFIDKISFNCIKHTMEKIFMMWPTRGKSYLKNFCSGKSLQNCWMIIVGGSIKH